MRGYVMYDEDNYNYRVETHNGNDAYFENLKLAFENVVGSMPKVYDYDPQYRLVYERKADVKLVKDLYNWFVSKFEDGYRDFSDKFRKGWLKSAVNLKGNVNSHSKTPTIRFSKRKFDKWVVDFTVECLENQTYRLGYQNENGDWVGHSSVQYEQHYDPKVYEINNSWEIQLIKQLEKRNFHHWFENEEMEQRCLSVKPHPSTYEKNLSEDRNAEDFIANKVKGGGNMFESTEKDEKTLGQSTTNSANTTNIPEDVSEFADELGTEVTNAEYNDELEDVVYYLDDNSVIVMEEGPEGEPEPANYPSLQEAISFTQKFQSDDYNW